MTFRDVLSLPFLLKKTLLLVTSVYTMYTAQKLNAQDYVDIMFVRVKQDTYSLTTPAIKV